MFKAILLTPHIPCTYKAQTHVHLPVAPHTIHYVFRCGLHSTSTDAPPPYISGTTYRHAHRSKAGVPLKATHQRFLELKLDKSRKGYWHIGSLGDDPAAAAAGRKSVFACQLLQREVVVCVRNPVGRPWTISPPSPPSPCPAHVRLASFDGT
jgi:hypothetical protein